MRKTIVSCLGGVALYAGAAAADSIPERLMNDLQADLQLTQYQAAGVVGNLARETGNFRYMVELEPLIEGARGGIGYAQWTGERHDAFISWAEDGADLTDYEVNYGYILYELNGEFSHALRRLRQTETIEEASASFMENYVKPHEDYRFLNERVAYATAYAMGDFSGAGCQKWHHVTVDGRRHLVATCDEIADLNAAKAYEGMVFTVDDSQMEVYLSESADADTLLIEELRIASTVNENIPDTSQIYDADLLVLEGLRIMSAYGDYDHEAVDPFAEVQVQLDKCTVDPFAEVDCSDHSLRNDATLVR